MEHYSAIKGRNWVRWMNLESVVQSKITQKEEKQISYINIHKWNLKNGTEELIFRAKIPKYPWHSAYYSVSPLLTPGNHWYFYYLHSFGSSRMSYSWNHTICTLLRLASSLKHDVVGKKQTKKNVEYRYSIKYWGNLLKGRTWVWSNSGRQWRTGRAGVLQPMGSQRVGHWMTTTQKKNKTCMSMIELILEKVDRDEEGLDIGSLLSLKIK